MSAMKKKKAAAKKKKPAARAGHTPPPQGSETGGFPIVGVGASAGGLEAFEAFFKAMPQDSGIAFVLVAHLDRTHVSILPELLQKHTGMPVHQIKDGMQVQRDHVYVIPPNKDLSLLNGRLHLMEPARARGANLPIDFFFRSLAQDQGGNAVCIILSGTGTDGTLGLKAIKGETGMVMVQDEASAKYDGMPRNAIATHLADYVLPPGKMPEQLIRYTKHAHHKDAARIAPALAKVPDALQKVFITLRARTDHDFSLYKKNTICRRIERRMNLHQIRDISEYVRYLQESDHEVDILFKELLIGVTNFFRDPKAFANLKDRYLLKLLQDKPDDYTIRVWVPGCSSGEEAYSVAILLYECMQALNRRFNVQIFGTDIDHEAIDAARLGLYPESVMNDVGPERISRHFTGEEDGLYRIKKSIREMLVFAPQNVIKDPPFTKLDLVCCRNLLIYLGPELQKRLLRTFQYCLRRGGLLFLGSSETVGQNTDAFELLDKKWKIFRRRASHEAAHPVLDFPAMPPTPVDPEPAVQDTIQMAEELSAFQMVETILQQSGAPPCAIINDACNVLYIHGRTGRFLEPAEGKVSVNILEMARSGLKPELATAIRRVCRNKREFVVRNLRVPQNGDSVFLDLIVRPIFEPSAMRGLLMVVFQETGEPGTKKARKPRPATAPKQVKTAEEVTRELDYTRETLQTTIEELETSNEELKSTNEELQSTNEELQSTNEEMETSKEELQSLNEESATVNAELQSRIDELSKTNDDMKNLLDSTEIATIFLDEQLCVRRFTPKTGQIIPLTGTDIGRPIKHFASNLIDTDLSGLGKKVLKDLAIRELEVGTRDGRTFFLRVRPYRTVANVIDGVVMTFDDITDRKQAEDTLHLEKMRWERTIDALPDLIAIIDRRYKILRVNRSLANRLGCSPEECVGQNCHELLHGVKARPPFCPALETMADGEERRVEISEERLGGDFVLTIIPLTDLRGALFGGVHVYRERMVKTGQ